MFARKHGIKIGTIADLIHYRLSTERTVVRITAAATVRARSAAEMPVVTPVAASMDTVNAVLNTLPFGIP